MPGPGSFWHRLAGEAFITMASGGVITPPITSGQISFARNFFRASNKSEEAHMSNLIVSPAGARSAMTLIFMGAGGKSANELRSALILGDGQKLEIAQQHADFISKDCVCSDKGVSIRMATGLYVKQGHDLHSNFNTQATEFFNAQADSLNFADAEGSMRQVNTWIENQTFNTVRNLLTPSSFGLGSGVILINSLYFNAKWAKMFSLENTLLGDFAINEDQKMQLAMMRQVGQFRFGESKKLKSRILQLPFEDSDINLLLIVPFDTMGLVELESALEQVDLNEVALKSVLHEVEITIPRFKVESDIDLKLPLKNLGIKRIFKKGVADLTGLFAKKSTKPITEARQKLFMNINEAGCLTQLTDAAAAPSSTDSKANPDRKVFIADHPFVFAVRNNTTVHFVGHFVKP